MIHTFNSKSEILFARECIEQWFFKSLLTIIGNMVNTPNMSKEYSPTPNCQIHLLSVAEVDEKYTFHHCIVKCSNNNRQTWWGDLYWDASTFKHQQFVKTASMLCIFILIREGHLNVRHWWTWIKDQHTVHHFTSVNNQSPVSQLACNGTVVNLHCI